MAEVFIDDELMEWKTVTIHSLDDLVEHASCYSRLNEREKKGIDELLAAKLQDPDSKVRALYLIVQGAIYSWFAFHCDQKQNEYQRGEYIKKAKQCYEEAMRLDENLAGRAYTCLGKLYDYNHHVQNSIYYYEKAFEKGYSYAAWSLALIYQGSHRGVEYVNYKRAAYLWHFVKKQPTTRCDVPDCKYVRCQRSEPVRRCDKDGILRGHPFTDTAYHLAMATDDIEIKTNLFTHPEHIFPALKHMLCDDDLASIRDKQEIYFAYEDTITEHLLNAPVEQYQDIKQALNKILFQSLLAEYAFYETDKLNKKGLAIIQNIIRWTGKEAKNWQWVASWYEDLTESRRADAIPFLESVLLKSLTPGSSVVFPKAAYPWFYYVLGSLHRDAHNTEQAKKIFSLVPYDAAISVQALEDIGSLFCVGITPLSKADAPALQEEKQEQKPLKSNDEQDKAKQALPYLLTALQRDPKNNSVKRLTHGVLDIAENKAEEILESPVLSPKELSEKARYYWIKSQVEPLHKEVMAIVQGSEKRLKEKDQLEFLPELQNIKQQIADIYQQCLDGNKKASEYREEALAIIQKWLASDATIKHSNILTKVARGTLNILCCIIPVVGWIGCYLLQDKIAKTHVSTTGFKSHFFSFSTERQVEAKRAKKQIEELECRTISELRLGAA